MGAEPALPLISVVVPVHNGSESLGRCLAAIAGADYQRYECIVVDDGSTDDSRAIAERFPVRSLPLGGGPSGPAYARNRGAEAARGEILFFVDADVVIHGDALARVAETLTRHPDVDAVFGSYDEAPEAPDFVSQYKNLSHHFVHQQGRAEGGTFWSGCGAVRREVFLEVGGFDARRYPRPSIEDIDLGCRLRASGHRVLLNKEVQAKHLKRWTLRGMTRSDVFDRAIPWTLLILRERNLPNDLNLRLSQRMSALLLYAILLYLGFIALFQSVGIAIVFLLAGLFLLVVSYWRWPEAFPYLPTRRAEAAAYVLVAAITALALYSGSARALLPLAPLLVGIVVGHWLPRLNAPWSRAFFAAVILGVLAALALVLADHPVWVATPLLAGAGLIVLLNFRFYAFFARQRGVVFALAVVPFQMLYYFYSVLAFAMAASLYVWGVSLKR